MATDAGVAGKPGAPNGAGNATPLRTAIAAAKLRSEPECLPALVDAATLSTDASARVKARTLKLVRTLRAKPAPQGIAALVHEYSLSSEEGVSLMCLAEALLRIPDNATRDALIRDKVATGDWLAHVSADNSLFVNAATWGLAVTGRIVDPIDQRGLRQALSKLVSRGGEPIIRRAVDLAMRLMGEQFVTGQTIDEALANSRRLVRKGFSHSYDMLGEAAVTEADALGYMASYEAAIQAIGVASAGAGPYRGPGISVKLSALHPRYERAQRERVAAELLPRLTTLAALAKSFDIGFNIDAEEADRLEISLDLLEALAFNPALADWNGLGFVVQAYGKRCPLVIDWLIDLARRSGRRLMIRLVKGAYWDSEIKRAQVLGLPEFPVYTRKIFTDVAYIACAKRLLAARDAVFPQFATHNAQTLATIYEIAGADFAIGDWEFQCLHGMGEALYEEVVGPEKLDRPCRIYAPVGPHERLLAYLVRRLLENGANSSFVNRIADEAVSPEALAADPVELARTISPPGAPNPAIALPQALFGPGRRNSAGLDLTDDATLAEIATAIAARPAGGWRAVPLLGRGPGTGTETPILNPADNEDRVGTALFADPAAVDAAFAAAQAAAPGWAATPPSERARLLVAAADRLEAEMVPLIGLIVREAGKSIADAVGEIREAADFLRYYGATVRDRFDNATHRPLGTVVAISPWNFPLSIFLGQASAALAAGNAVIAKPAEETPLIAAAGIRILHEAGIPHGALQFLPGAGDVGAALCGHAGVGGVVFTGSTEVARLIARQLASRLSTESLPIPLIAETAGQNAMIVDSSALTEQVVGDVLASAFNSAGQRCSALRLLCLQNDIADKTLDMLKGALAELRTGNPARLATDVGPIITVEARDRIENYVEAMRDRWHTVTQGPISPQTSSGSFMPPTLIELSGLDELGGEVFGPVLHVIRFRRAEMGRLVERINGLGYGLTFGLHTRLDETIERVTDRISVGNIYINRNIIGAVVGVQPFGGHGLSGTGPKAGGPLYLRRFLRARPPAAFPEDGESQPDLAAAHLADWLAERGKDRLAGEIRGFITAAPAPHAEAFAGPVGESNTYRTEPRGRILVLAESEDGLLLGLGATLATGNDAVIPQGSVDSLPATVARRIIFAAEWRYEENIGGALVEGSDEHLITVATALAGRDGVIVPVQRIDGGLNLDMLVREVALSINTAAAGGNASLMALAES